MKGHTIQQARACAPAAPAGDTVEGPVGLRRKIKAYIHLTKPQVIELLLVTTAPTMMFAAHGMPSFWLMMNTLIGGAMAAGRRGRLTVILTAILTVR
ncbi:heme O synthase [Rothia aeria]|uniref:Heme O synthase n=1 Tax=Rothia aeria TaxID=172042 RepID=A0A2Z5R0J2_9MICC|nr:heme O synthase [Rothia aeria]